MSGKVLNTTELDFDEIKGNLTNYFKNHPNQKYTDWDFEGSGLNLLLDVLAYNTYTNSRNIHMAINESFIDSAQLRNNVVARAKLLGYTPGSVTSAKASLYLRFEEAAGTAGYFELPIGSKFTTTIDGVSYFFITRNSYASQLEDGVFKLFDVEIYEGREKSASYLINSANEEQKIILDDEAIDVNKMDVRVYDNPASTEYTTYSLWQTFENEEITGDTPIYFLSENADGKYEIRFGNGVFGKKPESQSLARIFFLTSQGTAANGASIFEWSDNDPAPSLITTTSPASNGSDREGIESIRFNAPTTFAAQNRTVTPLDYRTIISSEFKDIDNMAVWGGQDNVPPVYGKAFICIKPPAAETLSDQQKIDILNLLDKKKVIAIIPEIVDPEYTFLYFEILFKYDNTQTTLTNGELISVIRDEIQNYNDNILTKFNGVFRHSEFLNIIDESESSILNSTARVKAYKVVNLTYGNLIPQTVEFRFEIEGEYDQETTLITSDSWTYKEKVLRLADEPIPNETTYRNIYAYEQDASGNAVKIFTSLGKLYLETGEITLEPIPVEQNEIINIYLEPKSNDIASKRSNLLSIDLGKTKFTPGVDTISVSGAAGARNYRTYAKNF